jgi:hypothetical protein
LLRVVVLIAYRMPMSFWRRNEIVLLPTPEGPQRTINWPGWEETFGIGCRPQLDHETLERIGGRVVWSPRWAHHLSTIKVTAPPIIT